MHFTTPLRVRNTIRRIRSCPQPLTMACSLLKFYPWFFPVPTPLYSPHELQAGSELVLTRQRDIDQLLTIPLFRIRDTPLRSLYRLYENLCANRLPEMGFEVEYFFLHKEDRWLLSRLPDPRDDDCVRYCVLACLVEALVESFNWKMSKGLRRDGSRVESGDFPTEVLPEWVKGVVAIDEELNLMGQEKEPHNAFKKRNILAPMGYLFTI